MRPPACRKFCAQLVERADELAAEGREGPWRIVARAAAARVWFVLRTGLHAFLCRHRTAALARRFDVVLCGFWDWSVKYDAKAEKLVEWIVISAGYPRSLNRGARKRRVILHGSTRTTIPRRKRDCARCCVPLAQRDDVVLLQRFIGFQTSGLPSGIFVRCGRSPRPGGQAGLRMLRCIRGRLDPAILAGSA